jgi:acetate kinase
MGIYRYGFHGLSCHYLVEELERIAGSVAAKRRTIIAHLGHGASLTALKNGRSIDTSMGFTPASGIPMSSRSGDLDPGVVAYLFQHEEISATQFNDMVNREAGLLGISETSADMRELLEREISDARAAEAIDLFCYQAKKWIGSLAAALGGLDNLVFSGGIGEHAPPVRARICRGLEFLGITLDTAKNEKNEPVISTRQGKVTVRVLATNEELMMAKLVSQVITYSIP